jgi:hypothetical protein
MVATSLTSKLVHPVRTQEGFMSRRIRYLAVALFASLMLGAAACANPAAPFESCGGPDTPCFTADGVQNSGT